MTWKDKVKKVLILTAPTPQKWGGFWKYHEELKRLGLEPGPSKDWKERRLE